MSPLQAPEEAGTGGGVSLSVVTPTFNRLRLLSRCLDALAAQSEPDFEVVVAVDGSTDGTLALLTALAHAGSLNLKVLPLERGGQAAARNAAIRAATGSVLVFVDDDLLLAPDALARHRAFHEVFERSVAIGGVRYERGTVFAPPSPTWVDFTGMNSSLPKALAVEAGLFDASLSGYGGEDLEFALRLSKLGASFKALRGAWATHLGERVRDPDKGRSAGRQAVQVAARYGPAVAWRLGVHPTLLAAKRALYNPVTAALAGRSRGYAWERAYQEGALEAQAALDAERAAQAPDAAPGESGAAGREPAPPAADRAAEPETAPTAAEPHAAPVAADAADPAAEGRSKEG
ncbi:MAG TPA: glycosyltransferase family A protein [Deinococcales bacterium]|nr:glycosyltransferase family A protein [Deinococcales bacterium]